MSPHHTLFLFWTENSLFKALVPLPEAFPPLLHFLGPLQDTSPFLAIMRCTVLPFATAQERERSSVTAPRSMVEAGVAAWPARRSRAWM